MLSIFPELLTYQMFAPLLLRVVLGLILINLGYLKFNKEKARFHLLFQTLGWKPKEFWTKVFGTIEMVGGVALIVGFWTQIAALVFVIINFAELFIETKEASLLKRDAIFYLLIFIIALSLLFTGPGFLAFDLPL